MKRMLAAVFLWLFTPCLILAQNLQDYEKKITEFALANGLHFIVFERHEAPVVSFHTYVNGASVDDPGGKTGLAHMFEHMAFKGTRTIGSKNYLAERKTLDAVEAVYDRLEAERNLGLRADVKRVEALEKELQTAIEKANQYVDPEAFTRIIEENGGVGLNAGTGEDSTDYFYSLPANRVELWFLMESSRFRFPVYREFYKERDVVREERRMRIESNPQGKLMETLLATAFAAHPYRNLPGGWGSDIESLRVRDAERFFRLYYAPVNLTVCISGDVNPQEMKRLATKYFATLPKMPPPPPVITEEPPQEGEKRAIVMSPAQPLLMIGYKRPDQRDKDDPVFDVLGSILSSGRTGLLYKELVRAKRIALAAQAQTAFPGSKYPNLFIFLSLPTPGHTVEENEKAIYDILERLKREPVDEETLSRVKTKIRASVIRGLDSNSGMASNLCFYYANYGDWRKLFTVIDDIRKVTAADVQRVAREYFIPETRTVAYTAIPAAAKGAR
jgi:predicted Zn-dependent peptidase